MFPAALRVLHIKDLKDLSVFFGRRCYRHAGPKGPEEMFFAGVIAGACPPRYGEKNVPLTVARGPVPRHAIEHACAPPLCRARAPALDLFGLRCSRTTVFSRSFRTLMSIVYADLRVFKVL